MTEKRKKFLGILFIILGLISIITPLTPFGILFFIGLELLGIRFILVDKIKKWYDKGV